MARHLFPHAALALLLATRIASAADADPPHPHQGLLEPFEGRPPEVVLDTGALAKLAEGGTVLTRSEADSGGRGMAVQDIHASADTIWNRIGAFREYPRMVDHVEECEPYLEVGSDLRVRFVLGVIGLKYEYFIEHDFHPERGYVTWTLDYTRESDLDDSVGYWAVLPHPERPGWSRLFYSIDMRVRGWMPGFLRNMIANEGLRDATSWVKRESETLQRERDAAAQGGE